MYGVTPGEVIDFPVYARPNRRDDNVVVVVVVVHRQTDPCPLSLNRYRYRCIVINLPPGTKTLFLSLSLSQNLNIPSYLFNSSNEINSYASSSTFSSSNSKPVDSLRYQWTIVYREKEELPIGSNNVRQKFSTRSPRSRRTWRFANIRTPDSVVAALYGYCTPPILPSTLPQARKFIPRFHLPIHHGAEVYDFRRFTYFPLPPSYTRIAINQA